MEVERLEGRFPTSAIGSRDKREDGEEIGKLLDL